MPLPARPRARDPVESVAVGGDEGDRPPSRSGDGGSEEYATRGRMLEESDDEVAMPIERRRAAEERHQTVSRREREETVDILFGQPLRDAAQDQLPPQFGSEAAAPFGLIRAERGGRRVAAAQRGHERLAREARAEQAVIDAAAGCRLHDAGRVAEDDDAIGERPLDGPERQDLLTGLTSSAEVDAPARRDRLEHAIEVRARVARAHDADAHVRTIALDRHCPRESARRDALAEMHFDVTETRRR